MATPCLACPLESRSRSRRMEDTHDVALLEAREAHQQTLEDAHVLECDIEILSWGVEDTQYPHPHSCSSIHPQSQSLDRHLMSPKRHRLERRVTFWEPEVEPDPSERPYRGPWECSCGIHLDSDGVPPFTQRQETLHPLELPIPYLDIGGGGLPT